MKVCNFCLLAFILIQGCIENKQGNKDSHAHPEISFDDQIELKIDDKYFTVQVDSIFSFLHLTYRFDIKNKQLIRYWVRDYNKMWEVRFYNREVFEKNSKIDSVWEEKGYNYLFGIKNGKAFYLRWRNEPENPNNRFQLAITSDIGKYTVKLQTNLPKNIIKHYYPDIKCPIEMKEMERTKIKTVNLGNIISSNYQPFY